MKIFGERLKELMKVRNISGNDLAEIIGVSQTNLSHYRNNGRDPQLPKLVELCDCLHVTMDYMYGLAEYNICMSDLTPAQQGVLFSVYRNMVKLNYSEEPCADIEMLRIGKNHPELYQSRNEKLKKSKVDK